MDYGRESIVRVSDACSPSRRLPRSAVGVVEAATTRPRPSSLSAGYQPQGWNQGPQPPRQPPPYRPPPYRPPPYHPPPCQPAASTVGAAATVAGGAGAGAAAAIGAAPIATAAAPAANIGVMHFNPIRIMELPFDGLSALPFQVCAASDRFRHRRHQLVFRPAGRQSGSDRRPPR